MSINDTPPPFEIGLRAGLNVAALAGVFVIALVLLGVFQRSTWTIAAPFIGGLIGFILGGGLALLRYETDLQG